MLCVNSVLAVPVDTSAMFGISRWLARSATMRPAARAYTFLANGEAETDHLTYAALADRVRRTAAGLTAAGHRGEPVLLVMPAGLDFVVGLLACLEAGAITVPLAVPRFNRSNPGFAQIVAETRTRCLLTTPELRDRLAQLFAFPGAAWRSLEDVISRADSTDDAASLPPVGPDDPAILQYTSGSTGRPKGVVITHANLAHNEGCIRDAMGHGPDLVGVGWLPHFHDMGLVGNILQTLAVGGHLVLMPPSAMVQLPLRWLRAISHYGGTTSGGPNFAYDLCVERITAEQKAGLDLSRWRVAFVGAEPVRAATLARFEAAFAGCGFRAEAWLPCYGLAEATLMVSGSRGLRTADVDAEALKARRWRPVPATHPQARRIVSCGRAAAGVAIALRDPATGERLGDGRIGEILVAGDSVGRGYWEQPEASAARFGAQLPDGAGPFLATGDLGVMEQGELFVLGRTSELMIVRGQNFYPEDLEQTAQHAHAAAQPGGAVVFSFDAGTAAGPEESVVVLQEIQRAALASLAGETVARAIAQAIAAEHRLAVREVVLLRPGQVLRTTSGKIQRSANRTAFLDGRFEPLFRMQPTSAADAPAREPARLTRAELHAAPAARRERLVVACLKAHVARLGGRDPLELDSQENLLELGLDSVQLLEVKQKLDELAGRDLPLDAFVDAGTLAGLAAVVVRETGAAPAAPSPAATAGGSGGCPVAHSPPPPVPSPVSASAPAGRRAPGPDAAELDAELAHLSRDFPGYLLDLTRRYGEVVRLVLGPQEIYLVAHPQEIGTVMVSAPETWARRGVWAPFRPVMGPHGLITSEGPEWRAERSFAQPEFTRAAAAAERPAMAATVARVQAGWVGAEPLALLPAAKRLTLEIILAKLFGPLVTAPERDELYAAVADIDKLWNVPAFFLFAGRGGGKLAAEHGRSVAQRVAVIDRLVDLWIGRVLAAPAAAPGLMGHYARSAGRDAEAQRTLRDVAVTYLLTGFDTTASGIYWTVALLLENEAARVRLETELAAGGPDETWLQAVVAEALRLYPPVWYVGREALVATELRGYAVPAGAFAIASPYVVHRNPWLWPEPLAFRPERFLAGAPDKIPAKAYLPFGLGARMCIGMHVALAEIALAVGHLFRHHRVETVSGHARGLCSDFTLTPREPLQVRVAAKQSR